MRILIDFLKLWDCSNIIQLITRCSAARVSVFDVVKSSIALRRNDRSTCANLDRLFENSEISFLSVISRCSAVRVLDFCKSSNLKWHLLSSSSSIDETTTSRHLHCHRSHYFRKRIILNTQMSILLCWSRNENRLIFKIRTSESRFEMISKNEQNKLQDNNKRCSEIITQLFT